MTSELRVKKQPVPATLFMTDGTTLSGTIFLSPVGPSHAGRETVREMMEGSEQFIPFRSESERFLLLGKAGVVATRMVTGEQKPELPGRVSAEVKLVGGLQFNGRMITDHDSDRLSDVLNHSDNWLRLETLNGIVWIRREAISIASSPCTPRTVC